MALNIRSHSRQESSSDKFTRSVSPPPAIGHKQSDLHDSHTQQYLQHCLTPPTFLDQEHKASSPSKKISGNNFLRMARQASDTAFRTVGLNRKTSESNLNTTFKGESPDSTEVYEQNPRAYLYQQQTCNVAPLRPQHSRPHSDDNVSADWAMNNQIHHSEPTQHNDYQDPLQLHSKTERLRRNASLPDMKVEYSKDGNEPATTRPASPANLLPGQATNRSRSRSRVQPHHFITTAMSNEPISASSPDAGESDLSQQLSKDQVHIPETPLRGSSRTARTRPNNPQQSYQDQHRQPQQSQLEQRKGLLARHQTMSDESLSKDVKTRLPQHSKDLPPTPPSHPQIASRIRRRIEGGEGESAPLPVLPAASETLMKIESIGLIPQDVLKNMDPKDMKKAMMATVIASRVYKVMSSEQLGNLKKEQCTLEDFIESMNIALHIEIRMRDASHSLIRLHENCSNLTAVKIASSQLNATTRKMDDIFQKTQEAMWRLVTIQRLLLQHESAILNAGLRRLDSENRELSRTVMELEESRGQEKEEKIKWKKEHNRLKFQSILIPATPVPETFADGSGPSNPEMQQVLHQHQTQLASMGQYVKSLNDDILQKDDKITDVTNQLQAVKHWADDFMSVVQGGKTEIGISASNDTLQAQLHCLQSSIEFELKGMRLQVQEIKSEAKIDSSKKSAHSRTQSAPTNDPRPESHLNRTISEIQRQERRARAPKSHSRKGSDLQNVLHQSLLELDRQILLEDGQSTRSSRSSSTSTDSTASSNDFFDRVPANMSRASSGSTSSGQGSRTRGSGSSSDEDTAVEEDISKEIDQLNSIMEELRQQAAKRNIDIAT